MNFWRVGFLINLKLGYKNRQVNKSMDSTIKKHVRYKVEWSVINSIETYG